MATLACTHKIKLKYDYCWSAVPHRALNTESCSTTTNICDYNNGYGWHTGWTKALTPKKTRSGYAGAEAGPLPMARVMMMMVKTADATVSKTTANMVMKFMATLQNGATERRTIG